MNKTILSQFSNIIFDDTKPTDLPNTKSIPVSSTEKQIREEVNRLNQSIEEIKKFREEIEKKTPKEEIPE